MVGYSRPSSSLRSLDNNTGHRENGLLDDPHQKNRIFPRICIRSSLSPSPSSFFSSSLFFPPCFFNAISGLLGVLYFKFLPILLYKALVWLASTFVRGSKPGEDQGPRRSGRQRATLISTVLSSYYRAWNRFLNDNDQTRERERKTPFSLPPFLRSRSNLETIFHFRTIAYPSLFLPYPLGSLFGLSLDRPPFFSRGDGSSSIDQKRLKTLAPVTRYANIFTAPLHLTAEINDSRGREEGIVDEDRDVLPPRKSFVTGRDQRVT